MSDVQTSKLPLRSPWPIPTEIRVGFEKYATKHAPALVALAAKHGLTLDLRSVEEGLFAGCWHQWETQQSEGSASDDCSIEERLREMADAKVLNVTLYREAAVRIETLKRELTRPSGTEQANSAIQAAMSLKGRYVKEYAEIAKGGMVAKWYEGAIETCDRIINAK